MGILIVFIAAMAALMGLIMALGGPGRDRSDRQFRGTAVFILTLPFLSIMAYGVAAMGTFWEAATSGRSTATLDIDHSFAKGLFIMLEIGALIASGMLAALAARGPQSEPCGRIEPESSRDENVDRREEKVDDAR